MDNVATVDISTRPRGAQSTTPQDNPSGIKYNQSADDSPGPMYSISSPMAARVNVSQKTAAEASSVLTTLAPQITGGAANAASSAQLSRLLDPSSSDEDSDYISSSSSSSSDIDGEEAALLSYTDMLSRGVDDAMRHFGLDVTKDLIGLVTANRRDIMTRYASSEQAAQATRTSRKATPVGDNSALLSASSSIVRERGQKAANTTSEVKLSVRQLTSWKVAIQRNKNPTNGSSTAMDEGDTFYSSMPLQYNDSADVGLTSKKISTPQQDSHDRIIRFMQTYMVWITLFFTVLHITYFIIITIRCSFNIPYQTTGYIIEWILLEAPMMAFAVITDIVPKEHRGVYRVQTKVEVMNYLKSRSFVSDALGSLPLDIIGFSVGSKCSVIVPTACGIISPYWKLNRVLLARYALFNTGDLMEAVTMSTGYPPQVARLTLTLIYFFLTTHATTCIFSIYLHVNESLTVRWLKDPIFLDRSTSDKYFQGFDWATKSMMGFARGDPFNIPFECVVFVLIVAFLGIIIFAVLVALFGALLVKKSPFEVANDTINLMYDDFSHRNLPVELRDEVRKYFWHLHDTVGKKDVVMDALQDLPKQLQVQLTLQIGRDMLTKVPLLAPEAHNDQFVMALTVALVPQIIPPFTVLFKKGDKGDSMAFVTSGSVAVVPTTFITTHDEEDIYFLLKTGSFFGEIALILGVPRTATIASLRRYANLLVLNEDIFRQIAADFPTAVKRMRLEAECRLTALNQGPEALNRERARRLLEAIGLSRMRFAFHQWLKFRNIKSMGGILEVGDYPTKYADTSEDDEDYVIGVEAHESPNHGLET
eukprot:GILI01014130.1.p1 GENE.GILI01014130.1~~GILI01014130.1.p1  ORF type:complete len:819 (+),score=131.69 GILI01014130.1:95-2551(+)